MRPGQTLGIIGSNGSGKSTLLKLLAGLNRPSTGEIQLNGRVSALIELGAGFHPEISGRENIYINGAILGLSRKQIDKKFDEIVAYAELEQFIDLPVKTYSSGMFMRLGFSVAVHVDPEILLIDEILAVGDESFVHKCFERIADFKRKGKTIVLVSHDLKTMERFCDEIIWIEKGVMKQKGFARQVVDAYLQHVHDHEERRYKEIQAKADEQHQKEVAQFLLEHSESVSGNEKNIVVEKESTSSSNDAPPESGNADIPEIPQDEAAGQQERWGNKEVYFHEVKCYDKQGEERYYYRPGEEVVIEMHFIAQKPQKLVTFGMGLFTFEGVCVFGTNTSIDDAVLSLQKGVGTVRFRIKRLELLKGSYYLDVAVHTPDGLAFDYIRRLHNIAVDSRGGEVGIWSAHRSWEFSGNVTATVAEKSSDEKNIES
jgi:ABC-type polysaccharide/polyol phosphate transport system ATPase subunit